jgi:tetratricopeptide (TPR) repeat protein
MGHDLIEGLRPFVASRDVTGLCGYLDVQWSSEALVSLLTGESAEAAKIGILCLGLKGHARHSPSLSRLLHHDDAHVVALAEHALWSIWLRAGTDKANAFLAEGIKAMNEEAYPKAVDRLSDAIRSCPGFAEAYNQRAIAWYLMEKYLRCVADGRKTLQLNPWHFGAAATLGHCYAHLGFYERSLEAYSTALKLHPRMEGVPEAIHAVRLIVNSASARRS